MPYIRSALVADFTRTEIDGDACVIHIDKWYFVPPPPGVLSKKDKAEGLARVKRMILRHHPKAVILDNEDTFDNEGGS